MSKLLTLTFLLLGLLNLNAQDVPVTNLYLFQLEMNGIDLDFTQPQFLTKFNLNGYNNQPSFFSNNELYITAQHAGQKQTDIYAFDLKKQTMTQVTATPESEFSPTKMPNGFWFSAVRVERDADATQRLWKFPIDRLGAGEPVFPYVRNVGYHFWLNRSNVALFIVGNPNQLVLADAEDGSSIRLNINNPGRCFQRLSNGNMAFVHKETDETWRIKEMDATGQTKNIVETLGGSEDFVILRDGTFLMGRGSKLYAFRPGKSEDWKLIGDFKNFGINRITRMAVSADGKIAMVGQ